MTPIIVVQGGQFGSEAKGAISSHLCRTRNIHFAVRTGAINAGHTVIYKGKPYAMQQLPTGWTNPDTKLIIGAGAYIHPDTLWREIDMVNVAVPESDVRDRLFIDYRCGIHDQSHENVSKDANRHHLIGATGKGCSSAIVDKIVNRGSGYQLFHNTSHGAFYRNHGGHFADTVRALNNAYDIGKSILIEGTQGTLLDMHLGPYPYTTSRMTSAANWVAEAGLSPALQYEVVLVCRTFPIRVAGNSGPMNNEIEWTDLARQINDQLALVGLPPKVDPAAIGEFEEALLAAAEDAAQTAKYEVPRPHSMVGLYDYDVRLSSWTTLERERFKVAASELHRDAIKLCSDTTVAELRKLVEMTTVTKKLRRIAWLDLNDLKYAVAINRPAWICLTFADYLEPELANVSVEYIANPGLRPAVTRLLDKISHISSALGVDVKCFTTGPDIQHFIDVADAVPARAS